MSKFFFLNDKTLSSMLKHFIRIIATIKGKIEREKERERPLNGGREINNTAIFIECKCNN